MAFDREKFLAQNKKNQDENPFTNLEAGYYICVLESANINNSKSSGREQCSFNWKLDESETNAGKYLGHHIGLDDPEGKGYGVLDVVLSTMGCTQEDKLKFAQDQEAFLDSLEGLKAKLHLTYEDGFSKIRIKKVLSSPLKGEKANQSTSNVSSPDLQGSNIQQPANTQIDIGPGLPVIVNKNGQFLKATVVSLNEAMGQVYVKYEDTNVPSELVPFQILQVDRERYNKTQTAAPIVVNTPVQTQQVPAVEELEDLSEPVKEPVKLEKGMKCVGKYNGQDITGEIHEIVGDIVKVKAINPATGKPAAFPCPKDSIVTNLPF